MSGSGRKSAYRKGVTKRVLYGDPEPKANEQIVRVVALRGSNLFEVVDATGAKTVTMLPTKFRKLIWVKRGDFLIVAEGDGGEATTAKGTKGAVTSIVEHILYKDQIKNLKQKELWYRAALLTVARVVSVVRYDSIRPAAFDDVSTPVTVAQSKEQSKAEARDANDQKDEADAKDGKLETQPPQQTAAASSKGFTMLETSFADLHVNRNRRKGHFDEEEEEEEEDE
ncbi:hypothetical protein BBJ28_00016896 [Nothophytophthora sp. Chile5]|nr:hypothetical protein BBJ28_00016896 [Nothophytophthora sp. Chile5]